VVTYPTGNFEYNSTTLSYGYTGIVYRAIPHYSDEPLSARYSSGGGRWNAAGTNLMFYTFTNIETAQLFLTNQAYTEGFEWEAVEPSKQRDLVVMEITAANLADLATSSGLAQFGLPSNYPVGFERDASWSYTQPIGARVYAAPYAGLVTRSASWTQWTGPITDWAEIGVFPDRIPTPVLLDRIPFDRWYHL
jgi:hypothetical protein